MFSVKLFLIALLFYEGKVEYWLSTISSFAETDEKCPPIIIVGTHLDKVDPVSFTLF